MILPHCFLLSFSFDWKDISNTEDSVLQHFDIVQLSSQCLEMCQTKSFMFDTSKVNKNLWWLYICQRNATQRNATQRNATQRKRVGGQSGQYSEKKLKLQWNPALRTPAYNGQFSLSWKLKS